jgi:hypothetical protein
MVLFNSSPVLGLLQADRRTDRHDKSLEHVFAKGATTDQNRQAMFLSIAVLFQASTKLPVTSKQYD